MGRQAIYDDVIPLSFPLRTKGGDIITQLPITKGQQIYVSTPAYNRLPQIWGDDADVWNPDRFLNNRVKAGGSSLGMVSNLWVIGITEIFTLVMNTFPLLDWPLVVVKGDALGKLSPALLYVFLHQHPITDGDLGMFRCLLLTWTIFQHDLQHVGIASGALRTFEELWILPSARWHQDNWNSSYPFDPDVRHIFGLYCSCLLSVSGSKGKRTRRAKCHSQFQHCPKYLSDWSEAWTWSNELLWLRNLYFHSVAAIGRYCISEIFI